MTSFKKCSKKGRENKEPFYRKRPDKPYLSQVIKVILTVKIMCLRHVRDDVFSAVTHYPNLIFTETSESFKLENILTNTS